MNNNYWRFWTATAVTNLGDGIGLVAFPWLATLLTDDPFLITLVAAATRLPWFLFSLPAGVVTDRVDRKTLIVQMDAVRFVLTLAIVGLVLSGADQFDGVGTNHLYFWALCAAALLLGTAEVFRDNAAQTMLPDLVETEELETANGRLWSVETVMNAFVGPPLAGFLIALSLPLPFVIHALCFGSAAFLVMRIPLKSIVHSCEHSAIASFKEGIQWLWAHHVIKSFALMLGFMNALSAMTLAILIIYAQDLLMLNAAAYGLLLTGGAAGGVFGGLVVPKLVRNFGAPIVLVCAGLAIVIQYLAIFFITNPAVVWAALFIEAFAAVMWNVVTVSLRQRVIPSQLLGRVNSVYRFFGWGGMPFGAALGGALIVLIEPELGRELALRIPFLLGAIGYGVITLLVIRLVRHAPELKV